MAPVSRVTALPKQRCRRNDFCVLRIPQPTRNQQAAERGPRARNADGTLLSADNADDCGTRIVIQPTSRKCSKTRYVLLFNIKNSYSSSFAYVSYYLLNLNVC